MRSVRSGACSLESLRLGEPLAGTASTVRGYLLLEHGGPWAAKAVQSPFPDDDTSPQGTSLDDTSLDDTSLDDTSLDDTEGTGSWLAAATAPHGVTPLLVRRHGAAAGVPEHPLAALVALSSTGGHGGGTHLTRLADLRSWDVGAMLDVLHDGGLPAGLQPLGTQYLVCTHGRRDACCAELGRPLAAVLSALAPEQTWECTHLGGHRVAANALVLPDGLVYGRLDPDDALGLVAAHAEHRLLPDLLRGRAVLEPADQVAEIAVRRAAECDRVDAVRLTAADRDVIPTASPTSDPADAATTRTTSHWQVGDTTWRVLVDTTTGDGPARPASCGADLAPAPAVHTVVEVTDVEEAGRGAHGWDEAHTAAPADPPPNEHVVQIASQLPPARALDLACGLGRHALWLAGRGWRVTAVDFSRAALTRARTRAEASGLTVDWTLADARTWTPDEQYDLVLTAFVHLPQVLERATSWLRPGGRLVLVGHALRNLTDGVGGPSDPRLLHDPDSLRRLADAAGLRVERCEEVERRTDAGPAVDVVLVATRPAGEPSGG